MIPTGQTRGAMPQRMQIYSKRPGSHAFLILMVFLSLSMSAFASKEGRSNQPPSREDNVSASFASFVGSWLASCTDEFAGTRDRLLLTEEKGSFSLKFMEIDTGSISWEVKPTKDRTTPYVGVLTYTVNTFISRGESRQSVLNGHFIQTGRRSVTEIFRYSNGDWMD